LYIYKKLYKKGVKSIKTNSNYKGNKKELIILKDTLIAGLFGKQTTLSFNYIPNYIFNFLNEVK